MQNSLRPVHTHTHTHTHTHVDLYLFRQVSDLDLHRLLQVTDGEVPDAAGHHVAVQRATALLLLHRHAVLTGNRCCTCCCSLHSHHDESFSPETGWCCWRIWSWSWTESICRLHSEGRWTAERRGGLPELEGSPDPIQNQSEQRRRTQGAINKLKTNTSRRVLTQEFSSTPDYTWVHTERLSDHLWSDVTSCSETKRLHVSAQTQWGVHVEYLLNLQDGPNNEELFRDRVSQRYTVCFNSTTRKITTFVKGVWCWCVCIEMVSPTYICPVIGWRMGLGPDPINF